MNLSSKIRRIIAANEKVPAEIVLLKGNPDEAALIGAAHLLPADTGPDVISYEATISDPKVFTKDWTIRMPLYRRTDLPRIMENECFMYADEAGKGVHNTPPGASSLK